MIIEVTQAEMDNINAIKKRRIDEIIKFVNETDLTQLPPSCITAIYSGVRESKGVMNGEAYRISEYKVVEK